MAVNSYNQVQFNQYVPRSFQEMLTPVLHVTQQEEALQNQYLESQDKIDSVMAMLNPELDKTAYSKLSKFKEDLTTAAEDLASKGFVDSGRKSNLLNLKKTYDTDFTNILNQATQRLQAASIQEQKALQDPTYRYNSARNVSLDEATNNPNIWAELAIKNGVSGAALQQQIAQQVSALKAEISENNPSLTKLKTVDGKDLLGQYMMSITQGASPQEVATAIANLTGNIKEATGIVSKMMGIVNNVMATNKVEDLFKYGTNEYSSLLGYASQGLYNAVGGTDRQIVKDERDIMKYQQQLELEKRQFEYNLDIRKAIELQNLANGGQQVSPFIPIIGNVSADFGIELDPERKTVQTNSAKFKEAAAAILNPKSYTKPSGRWDSIGPLPERLQAEYKRAGLSTSEFTKADGSLITPQEASTLLLQKAAILDERDKRLLIKNKSYVINNPEGLSYALPGLVANGKVTDENGRKVSFNLSDTKEKAALNDYTSGTIKINPNLIINKGKLEVTGVSGKKLYIDINDKEGLVKAFQDITNKYAKIINTLDAAGLSANSLVNSTIVKGVGDNYRIADKDVVLTPLQQQILNLYVNTTNKQTAVINEITEDILTNKK